MPYRNCVAAGHRKYKRDEQWFCRDCMALEAQGRQDPPEPIDLGDPETPKPPEA